MLYDFFPHEPHVRKVRHVKLSLSHWTLMRHVMGVRSLLFSGAHGECDVPCRELAPAEYIKTSFLFFFLVQTACRHVVETFGKLVLVGGESLLCNFGAGWVQVGNVMSHAAMCLTISKYQYFVQIDISLRFSKG